MESLILTLVYLSTTWICYPTVWIVDKDFFENDIFSATPGAEIIEGSGDILENMCKSHI